VHRGRIWHGQLPSWYRFASSIDVRTLLIVPLAYLGFERDDVRVITDENPWDLPTAENIRRAMAALVYDAQPNDSLLLYFSGHALQVKDMSGQEPNGLAECSLLCPPDGMLVTNIISLGICAMDYHGVPYSNSDTPGLISDNIMHQVMVKPLPWKCRLTAIFDVS